MMSTTLSVCLLVSFWLVKGNLDTENEILEFLPQCGHKVPTDLISDSTKTNVGEHPWIALVGYEDKKTDEINYACTGNLINSRYVLTTAVCLRSSHIPKNNQISHVRLGEHTLKTDPDCYQTSSNPCLLQTFITDIQIEETVLHHSYSIKSMPTHNIGLIRLKKNIPFENYHGFIAPICLPPLDIDPRSLIGEHATEVVGWDFGSGHPNESLMKEVMILANDEECEALYSGFEPENHICTKSVAIRKRCTGDSGSPLTLTGPNSFPFTLVGMLSYGPFPCGFSDSPTVFISISFYRDWINNNMRP